MKNYKDNINIWNIYGNSFHKFYNNFKFFSFKRFVSMFLDVRTNQLLSLLKFNKNAFVLDIGCGSGIHILKYVDKCRKIIGIDSSEVMLSMAKKELEHLDKTNWLLKLADAHNLPFKDNSFNCIISMGLLDYVYDPQRILIECYRILKDQGIIIFTIPKRPSFFSLLRTKIGNFVKNKIFDLPPISNTFNRNELKLLLSNSNFSPCYIKDLWTTMWIVKADKIER